MKRFKFKLNYLIIPALTVLIMILGSQATIFGLEAGWYDDLIKPSFNPPNWIFGPVWTLIYVLTTYSALLVWNKLKYDNWKIIILGLFIFNAIVNIGWSFAFFGFGQVGTALWLSTEIWTSVLILSILLWSRLKLASVLLWPYLLWVSFAMYLNYIIWTLN